MRSCLIKAAPLFLLPLILLTLFKLVRENGNMAYRQERGNRGEREAERFLTDMGLKIVERNWRYRHKEVDLIMEGRDTIHFVEVRSLSSPSLLKPYETIGPAKQRNLIYAASAYVSIKGIRKEVSLDIVSVLFENNNTIIEYFQNAFSPKW